MQLKKTWKDFKTVRELIYWSYANLAMADSAVKENRVKYDKMNYMIRTGLYNGLMKGTKHIRSFYDDEIIKMKTGNICSYCGSLESLSVDHIFPEKLGGKDDAENLIRVCRSCNSSKLKKDLMEWMDTRDEFLPLMIIRRYLKLVFNYCSDHDLLDKEIEVVKSMSLPFDIIKLPLDFPDPQDLKLNVV